MAAAMAGKVSFLAAYTVLIAAVFLVLERTAVWRGPAADASLQAAGANAAIITTLRREVLDLQEQLKVERQGRQLKAHGHEHAGEAEAEAHEPEHVIVTDVETHGDAEAATETPEGAHDHADHGHEEAVHDHAGHGHEEAAHDHAGHGHEEEGGHGSHGGEGEHAAGHGGHGGHGGGHHHGHGEVDVMTLAIAYMLFGFLSFNMIVLYLVNYPDENIRSATFRMLSTTISIFCAVLLNQAIFGFLYEQVLPEPLPTGLGLGHPISYKLKIVVGWCLMSLWWALLNVSMYRVKDDGISCYAYKNIVGHLTAFAAIETFGNMQQAYNEIELTIVVAAMSPVVYCIFAWGSMNLRNKALRRAGGQSPTLDCTGCCDMRVPKENEFPYRSVEGIIAPPHEEGAEEKRGSTEWIEELIDAEDEAAALCISFLIMQVFVQSVLGHIAPIEGDHDIHSLHSVLNMGKWTLAVLGAVVCTSMMRAYGLLYCIKVTSIEDETRPLARLSTFQHLTATLLLCWCFWRTISWVVKVYFTHAASKVITAGALTIHAVVTLICLDCFADRLRRKAQASKAESNNTPPMNFTESVLSTPGQEEDYRIVSPLALCREFYQRGFFSDNFHNERTIRSLMGSLGFLVGIVWEKAIGAAEEVIISSDISKEHPVAAKMLMAVVITAIVLPGWMMYIAPKATMTEKQHRQMIDTYGEVAQDMKTQSNHAKKEERYTNAT